MLSLKAGTYEDRLMDRSQTNTVRDMVIRTFRGYGASEADIAGLQDTLLIRDGHYCGRSFRTPSLMAMWLGGFVQFYDADGEMLGAVTLGESQQQRKAA
jgi:hypothetical protein